MSVLVENKTLFGVAGIAIGVALVAVGALVVNGSLFAGAAMSLIGVAMIGLGVADCVESKTLHALASIGLGLTLIAVGGFLVRRSAGDRPQGIAVIVVGVAVIGTEITTLRHATLATPTSDEYESDL